MIPQHRGQHLLPDYESRDGMLRYPYTDPLGAQRASAEHISFPSRTSAPSPLDDYPFPPSRADLTYSNSSGTAGYDRREPVYDRYPTRIYPRYDRSLLPSYDLPLKYTPTDSYPSSLERPPMRPLSDDERERRRDEELDRRVRREAERMRMEEVERQREREKGRGSERLADSTVHVGRGFSREESGGEEQPSERAPRLGEMESSSLWERRLQRNFDCFIENGKLSAHLYHSNRLVKGPPDESQPLQASPRYERLHPPHLPVVAIPPKSELEALQTLVVECSLALRMTHSNELPSHLIERLHSAAAYVHTHSAEELRSRATNTSRGLRPSDSQRESERRRQGAADTPDRARGERERGRETEGEGDGRVGYVVTAPAAAPMNLGRLETPRDPWEGQAITAPDVHRYSTSPSQRAFGGGSEGGGGSYATPLNEPLSRPEKEAESRGGERREKNGITVASAAREESLEDAVEELRRMGSEKFKTLFDAIENEDNPFEGMATSLRLVLEALCLVSGVVASFGQPKRAEFESSLRSLKKDATLYHRITADDVKYLSEQTLELLRGYAGHAQFHPALLSPYSRVAETLCRWIRALVAYYDLKRIEQLEAKYSSASIATESNISQTLARLDGLLSMQKEYERDSER